MSLETSRYIRRDWSKISSNNNSNSNSSSCNNSNNSNNDNNSNKNDHYNNKNDKNKNKSNNIKNATNLTHNSTHQHHWQKEQRQVDLNLVSDSSCGPSFLQNQKNYRHRTTSTSFPQSLSQQEQQNSSVSNKPLSYNNYVNNKHALNYNYNVKYVNNKIRNHSQWYSQQQKSIFKNSNQQYLENRRKWNRYHCVTRTLIFIGMCASFFVLIVSLGIILSRKKDISNNLHSAKRKKSRNGGHSINDFLNWIHPGSFKDHGSRTYTNNEDAQVDGSQELQRRKNVFLAAMNDFEKYQNSSLLWSDEGSNNIPKNNIPLTELQRQVLRELTMSSMDSKLRQSSMENVVPVKYASQRPEVIDLSKLRAELTFDNADGGVWKQGWELHPLFNVTTRRSLQREDSPLEHNMKATIEDDNILTGVNNVSNTNLEEQVNLTIIVVPFTHVDPTLPYDSKQILMKSIIDALKQNSSRTFIFNEISILQQYYEELATAEYRQTLKDLIESYQFQLTSGMWVSSPDEAITSSYAIEVTLQEGLSWINRTFGSKYLPKYVWAIGPSGYSSTIANLYASYNFQGIVLQEVHYAMKKYLAQHQLLEFMWDTTPTTRFPASEGDPKINSSSSKILTHIMPFYSYDISHSCGPDPKICCQYDFTILDYKDKSSMKTSKKKRKQICPWGIDPIEVSDDNIDILAIQLLDQYLKKATLFRYRTVLMPLGGDYIPDVIEFSALYRNHERLIDYINTNIPGINIKFGTLATYFDAVLKNQRLQEQSSELSKTTFPVVVGSFFPYADRDDEYATNYYTHAIFDRSTYDRLERILFLGETLGLSEQESDYARRTLARFQHHDTMRSSGDISDITILEARGVQVVDVINDWIVEKFIQKALGQNTSVTSAKTSNSSETSTQTLKNTIKYCGSYSDTFYPNPQHTFLCDMNNSEAIACNPLPLPQVFCNSKVLVSREFSKIRFPCMNSNYQDDAISLNATTGWMLAPIHELWQASVMESGTGIGNYVPVPLDDFVQSNSLPSSWNRTFNVVRKMSPVDNDWNFNATVIDFYYQTTTVEKSSMAYAVRLGLSTVINNNMTFFTDRNDITSFEWHTFRSANNLPLQSQIMPMSSMAFIQDNKTRLTVISEYGHGVTSSSPGYLDVYLNRGLINKGFKGGSLIISTRLRVVVEEKNISKSWNTTISPFVKRMWDEVQHPLEVYGVRLPRATFQKSVNRNYKSQDSSETTNSVSVQEVGVKKYTVANTFVPFVFMVYKRVNYLEQAIQSLRDSDFPKLLVPIIISQDGFVPEMTSYIETLKDEFKIIHLYHPYACFDHPNSFPGGNDTGLNEGYKGDSYGHKREAHVTCCKHHFTWLLKKVFSLETSDIHGPGSTQTLSEDDTFFFTEEDYLVAPTIYSAIVSGLNAMYKYSDKTDQGSGFFGLTFESRVRFRGDTYNGMWFTGSFTSGPMTISRKVFRQVQQHSEDYCRFDDYNWDWSIVHLHANKMISYTVLAPTHPLVQHIGLEGGMHSNAVRSRRSSTLSQSFAGTHIAGPIVIRPPRKHRSNGGWGHPADQEHCLKVLQQSTAASNMEEFQSIHR